MIDTCTPDLPLRPVRKRKRIPVWLTLFILLFAAACDSQNGLEDAAETGGLTPEASDTAQTALNTVSAAAAGPSIRPKAYVFVDRPTGGTYLIQNSKTFSAAGQSVSMVRSAFAGVYPAGSYQVLINGLRPYLNGKPFVFVTPATDVTGHKTCTIGLVQFSLDHLAITVNCRKNGKPTDMAFALVVYDKDAGAGFMEVDNSDGVKPEGPSHNPWGTGMYARGYTYQKGRFTGHFELQAPFPTGTRSIMLVNSRTIGVSCELFSFNPADLSGRRYSFDVRCVDASGDPAFTDFGLMAIIQAPKAGFAWANEPTRTLYSPHPLYSYNDGGEPVRIRRENTGRYVVWFDGLSNLYSGHGTVLLTAHGSAGASCSATNWTRLPFFSTTVEVRVSCTRPGGSPADSRFTLATLSK